MNVKQYTEDYGGSAICSFGCGRYAEYIYSVGGDRFLVCARCYIAIRQIENGETLVDHDDTLLDENLTRERPKRLRRVPAPSQPQREIRGIPLHPRDLLCIPICVVACLTVEAIVHLLF